MARKTKPACPGGQRGTSGGVVARQRDSRKSYHNPRNLQPLGSVSVYDGLAFVGVVVPRSGKWIAYDGNDRWIGTFDLRHRAERALYQAARPGGAR